MWQNDPFAVGTIVRALEFDRSMALLLGVFSRSATITRPSVPCIKAKTDLFPMLGTPECHSEIFSVQWE